MQTSQVTRTGPDHGTARRQYEGDEPSTTTIVDVARAAGVSKRPPFPGSSTTILGSAPVEDA
jgi:hypothetical protein